MGPYYMRINLSATTCSEVATFCNNFAVYGFTKPYCAPYVKYLKTGKVHISEDTLSKLIEKLKEAVLVSFKANFV